MRNFTKFFCLILLTFLVFDFGCATAKNVETFRVALKWEETDPSGFSHQFSMDDSEIANALEKYPTKFPDPLPKGGRIVMFYPCRVFGIFQKPPGKPYVVLTLDSDVDRDLTNDVPIEILRAQNWKEGITVIITRSYTLPSPHTEKLPYHVFYHESTRPDGSIRENLNATPKYTYKGEFRLKGKDYSVVLDDGDMGGRFIREKQVNVDLRVGLKDEMAKPGGPPSHRLFELIPIGDKLYELKAIAEDGSWVEFAASDLPTTAIGTRAPDITMTDSAGKDFRISDYRGRVLVLDFWYVWCKPCIAKFPAIKKMIESYADKPLAAIGVNIDIPERVEQAKKVIADNQLTWRQVVEGKGEFLPVYQVYGHLPESPMSFPIYVAIDESGVTRYATNDFQKMGRFLEAHFQASIAPEHFLFVPCRDNHALPAAPRPTFKADFSSEKVDELVRSGRLKLPDNLPKGAKVGLLPNGVALVAYAGPTAEKAHLIVDANSDNDLTKEQEYDIPVMNEPSPDISKAVNVGIQVHWASGGIASFDMAAYARSDTSHGSLEVYGLGQSTRFEGTFYVGKNQYAVEFTDINGDRLMTEDDWSSSGFLKLKMKKGDHWVNIHEGTAGIPLGRSEYRLRHVSDDGHLIELEKVR